MKTIIIFAVTLFSIIGNADTQVNVSELRSKLTSHQIVLINDVKKFATGPNEMETLNEVISRGYRIVQENGDNLYVEYSKDKTYKHVDTMLLKIVNEICLTKTSSLMAGGGNSYCQVK